MTSATRQRPSRVRMRGQPLLFLGTVVLVWTTARVVHHLPETGLAVALMETAATRWPDPAPLHADPHPRTPGALARYRASAARAKPVARPWHSSRPPHRHVSAHESAAVDIAVADRLLWVEGVAASADRAGQAKPPLVGGPLPLEPEATAPQPAAAAGQAVPGAAPTFPDTRWSVYGWSLLRQGTRPGALAPGAQYGGSQAGLIVRYALGDRPRALSLYARAATALASDDDRTLAIGAALRPWAAVPVDLAVERRFGLADRQRDRFAAMLLAGGGGALGRSRIRLNAFGQAGIVGRSEPQGFFDLQMLAARQVVNADDRSITVGGGVWAGGQQEIDAQGGKHWVHRVDLGPRVALVLPIRGSQLTVALDWRQRVDGNALPASGAAITVSTGF